MDRTGDGSSVLDRTGGRFICLDRTRGRFICLARLMLSIFFGCIILTGQGDGSSVFSGLNEKTADNIVKTGRYMHNQYGSQEDIRHNLKLFFVDGILFMPTMALISVSAVIPFFMDQLGASTFQIALATSMPLICVLLTQPVFGYIASRSPAMQKTFSKILFMQRLSFLLFIFLIPLVAGNHGALVNIFLMFWCIFNLFVGSYAVFFTPLVIRLLPPDKRGAIRGIGLAIGSFLGVGMSALIPSILGFFSFPYNYMTIFAIGVFFLLLNAAVFFFMRISKDAEPIEPLGMLEYVKKMPSTIGESPTFRVMIMTVIFLAIAHSILPFYTLYAIRVFSASETHVATFAGLAILSGAIANIAFGVVVDRYGPRVVAVIGACLVILAGTLALTTSSLNVLFVIWLLANISNISFVSAVSLLLGEISPPAKLPLYVSVYSTIAAALSAVIVLVLAPVMENFGFMPLFAIVLVCGVCSFMLNVFVLRRRMAR